MVAVKKLHSTARTELELKPSLKVQEDHNQPHHQPQLHQYHQHQYHRHQHRSVDNRFQSRFAGFIFVCNKDTLPDLDRRIFGLPAHHAESVKAIRRGMPLFLFNYSSRCLCGVFEAASDGGLNLDPYAWQNTEQTKFARGPVSRYPAQVRVRLRFQRPPLDEETFRPVLDHFEGHKFRLELTRHQVQQLLRLFGVPEGEFFGKQLSDCFRPFGACDSDSPRSSVKSDSDCRSECSSKGTYNGEEEWMEETPSEDHRLSSSLNSGFLSEKLGQIVLNDACTDHLEDLVYSATPKLSMPSNIYRKSTTNLTNDCHMWKKNYLKGLDHASNNQNKSHMLSGNESDPTDNNSVVDFVQNCAPHLPMEGKEGVVAMPVVPVQLQPLVFGTMAYMPVPTQLRECPLHMQKLSKTDESMLPDSRSPTKPSLDDVKMRDSTICFPEKLMDNTPSNLLFQLPTDSSSGQCMMVLSPSFVLPDGKYGLPLTDYAEVSKEGEQGAAQAQPRLVPIFLVPSVPRIVPVMSPMELLHFEILHFATLTRPSVETLHHVESAIDSVRSCVRMLWPDADVEVFGSFASGLCLQHSDVDLAIVDVPSSPSETSAFLLKKMGLCLKSQKWCHSCNVIETASVPVLKCSYQPVTHIPDFSISIDITIGRASRRGGSGKDSKIGKHENRHMGVGAREYVLQKVQEFPALAPLVLLLKSFLHHRGLNNVYSGGLGSFSLTLLVTFYLERVTEGLSEDFYGVPFYSKDVAAPNLGSGIHFNCSPSDYCVQGAIESKKVLPHREPSGMHCLGTLLLGFLNFFGSEDLTSQKIVLKGLDGSPGGKHQRRNRDAALWIDDPLQPGLNVGAGSFGMCHVQDSFREMLQVLIYRKLPIMPLCCSKMNCQDLVALRQLPQLRQLLQFSSW